MFSPNSKEFEQDIKARIDKLRKAIKVEEIVDELQKCALGYKIMDREQIKSAEILLKKALPDMKHIDHTVSASEDLAEFLAKGRERAANHK